MEKTPENRRYASDSASNLRLVSQSVRTKWENEFAFRSDGFYLRGSNLPDETLQIFLKELFTAINLEKWPSIPRFTLDLTYCRLMSDKSVKKLSFYIGTHLPNLRQLELIFDSCYKVSDHSLATLGNLIGLKLRELRSLNLSFTSSQDLQDQKLKKIASRVGKNQTWLTEINFNFQYSNITDEEISDLGSYIALNFRGIKRINLCFNDCQNLTNKGVKELASRIKANLNHLEYIYLNLDQCPKVTDQFKLKLEDLFSYVRRMYIR